MTLPVSRVIPPAVGVVSSDARHACSWVGAGRWARSLEMPSVGLGSALQSSLEGSPCPPAEQGIPLSSLQLWWGLQKTISFVTLPPRKSAVHPPQLLGICLVLGDSPEKANVGPLPHTAAREDGVIRTFATRWHHSRRCTGLRPTQTRDSQQPRPVGWRWREGYLSTKVTCKMRFFNSNALDGDFLRLISEW